MKNLKKVMSMLLISALLLGTASCARNTAKEECYDMDMAIQAAVAEDAGLNANYGTNSPMEGAEKEAYDAAVQSALAAAEIEAYKYAAEAEKAAASASKAAAEAYAKASAAVGTFPATTATVPSTQIPSVVYGKLVENPFISTATNNISTFSADVDTASYTYFRKLMNYGWSLAEIIQQAGSSIRTEEMINYFDYDYADPIDGNLFGIKSQIGPCPWNEDAVLLQLGLKADDAVSTKGNNLVFLIDVSGSMRTEDKLPLLKTAFTYLTETLSSDDVVSIVTYSGQERVVLEGCKGTYTDQILKAVNNLESGGSTNGQAGLQKAYEIAAKYYIEGGNNRIILASDGDLNVGIRSPEELKKFVEEKRDAGIYLTTLGFGTGNYRDANMEALADNGNGTYHYIDGASEAEKIFGTDLLSTLYTVAEDVKMQITFNQQAVAKYRLVGYENRLLDEEDFEDDTKDAGEVGAGHTVTVCYELILTEEAKSAPVMTAANLDIRYKHPGESQSRLISGDIDLGTTLHAVDDDFAFIAAVAEFSMILHESEYTDKESLGRICETLALLKLEDPYQREFRDLIAELMKR